MHPTTTDGQRQRVLDRLWLRMAEIYGDKWTRPYGDDAAKEAGQTWAKGLAMLTPHQIAAGIEALFLTNDDWPPSLPRFRGMCMGIPSLHSIRAELKAKHTARSPFARQVWSNLDAYQLRQADVRRHDQLTREAYDAAVEFVLAGGELPGPLPELAPPPEVPRTEAKPETVRQAIDSIAQALTDPDPPADDVPGANETEGSATDGT